MALLWACHSAVTGLHRIAPRVVAYQRVGRGGWTGIREKKRRVGERRRMEEKQERISKFVDQKCRRSDKWAHKSATEVKKWDYRNLIFFPYSTFFSLLLSPWKWSYVFLLIPIIPRRSRLFWKARRCHSSRYKEFLIRKTLFSHILNGFIILDERCAGYFIYSSLKKLLWSRKWS